MGTSNVTFCEPRLIANVNEYVEKSHFETTMPRPTIACEVSGREVTWDTGMSRTVTAPVRFSTQPRIVSHWTSRMFERMYSRLMLWPGN